jgi:hypothetical protein
MVFTLIFFLLDFPENAITAKRACAEADFCSGACPGLAAMQGAQR